MTFLLSFIPTVGLFLAMILPDLLTGALAAVLLGLALIEWTAPERDDAMSRRPQLGARLVGAGVMAGAALFGGGLDPIYLVVLIGLVTTALVVIDVAGRLQGGGEQSNTTN